MLQNEKAISKPRREERRVLLDGDLETGALQERKHAAGRQAGGPHRRVEHTGVAVDVPSLMISASFKAVR